MSWLTSFPWLKYSASENGAYCRWLHSFRSTLFWKRKYRLRSKNGKKTLEIFRFPIVDVQIFKLIIENNKKISLLIFANIDIGRQRQQLRIDKLIPIIRSVLLCGRQWLALRGHRDQGPLLLKMPVENDGKFKALLRFAIESGDLDLQQHLKTANANATFIIRTWWYAKKCWWIIW